MFNMPIRFAAARFSVCVMRLQFLCPPSGGALTMTPLYWNDEGSMFSQLYLRSKRSAGLGLTPKPSP